LARVYAFSHGGIHLRSIPGRVAVVSGSRFDFLGTRLMGCAAFVFRKRLLGRNEAIELFPFPVELFDIRAQLGVVDLARKGGPEKSGE